MKKLKISRASTAAFLFVVLALFSTTSIVVQLDQIASDYLEAVPRKVEDVVRSDKIETESSSSKNDGVQDASAVLLADVNLLKEQNHNNKQEDEVIDENENDPIPNLTEITADHIETELQGTA